MPKQKAARPHGEDEPPKANCAAFLMPVHIPTMVTRAFIATKLPETHWCDAQPGVDLIALWRLSVIAWCRSPGDATRL